MALEEGRFFIGAMSDKRFEADGLAEYGRRYLSSGVWELGDNLSVSPMGGMAVAVNYGAALVDGYPYRVRDNDTGPLTLTVEDADSEPRIDRVVIRKDVAAQRVYAYIKIGEPAASPAPPELDRTDAAYEISLAQIAVAAEAAEITADDLTDERGDAAVCGIVNSKISVNGTGSVTDGHLVVFDGISGKLIKDSGKKAADFEPANSNIQAHIENEENPHNVTAAQVGLEKVTNDKQLKAAESSVDGNLVIFSGDAGDQAEDSGVKISDLGANNILFKDILESAGTTLADHNIALEDGDILEIEVRHLSNVNGTTSAIQCWVNGDQTAGNYIGYLLYYNASTAGNATSGNYVGASNSATIPGLSVFRIRVHNGFILIEGTHYRGRSDSGIGIFWWAKTSAANVNRVQLTTDNPMKAGSSAVFRKLTNILAM